MTTDKMIEYIVNMLRTNPRIVRAVYFFVLNIH